MTERISPKFLALPVDPAATWQVGFVSLADFIDPNAADDDVGLVLWQCLPSGFVHAKPTTGGTANSLEHLIAAMHELPTVLKAHLRPTGIECNDRESAEKLAALLDGSGTQVSYRPEMPEWNSVVREMINRLGRRTREIPSLQDAGCDEGEIREFAEASAAFFRSRLWDHLDDTDLIQFEAPKPPRHLKYAVVLGAGAETYGLGFFNTAQDHVRMMTQRLDPTRIGVFSLTFESPAEAAPGDVALWQALGLPLETGEAFPSIHFFSKNQCRRPNSKELAFTTAMLQALAATSEDDMDAGRWTKSVEVSGRMVKCVMSIPNLTDPPDRAEWMRRGKIPDPRGNERAMSSVQAFISEHADEMSLDELNAAINKRFTGLLEEPEFPLDTPAQRGEPSVNRHLTRSADGESSWPSLRWPRIQRTSRRMCCWPNRRERPSGGSSCTNAPSMPPKNSWVRSSRRTWVIFGECWRLALICAPAKAWPTPCKSPASLAKPSRSTKKCCG